MGMRDVLTTLQNHPAWQGREAAREAGRGVGIAIGSWPGATEPAAAACALNRDGFLHVHIGSVDLTGTWTGFALIAAESFGISPDRVRVVAGDTSTAPYAGGAGRQQNHLLRRPSHHASSRRSPPASAGHRCRGV